MIRATLKCPISICKKHLFTIQTREIILGDDQIVQNCLEAADLKYVVFGGSNIHLAKV